MASKSDMVSLVMAALSLTKPRWWGQEMIALSPHARRLRAWLLWGQMTGAERAHGRSAFRRLFDGGKGCRQHRFGVACPLVQLFLSGTPHCGRELFHIPHFRHPRAGPAGFQTVGPAHIGAFVGACDKCKT